MGGPLTDRLSAGRARPPRPSAWTRWAALHPSCFPLLPVPQGITGAENPGGAPSLPSLSLAPARHLAAKQVGNRIGKRGLWRGGANPWNSLATASPGSCQTVYPARSCLPCARNIWERVFWQVMECRNGLRGTWSCIHSAAPPQEGGAVCVLNAR